MNIQFNFNILNSLCEQYNVTCLILNQVNIMFKTYEFCIGDYSEDKITVKYSLSDILKLRNDNKHLNEGQFYTYFIHENVINTIKYKLILGL
jgi:hypothetical protein